MPGEVRLAVYPGTFDPITLGHLDVLRRALRIFDRVEIAIGINVSKTALFSLEERMELVREATADLEGTSVSSFDGLVVAHARSRGAVALVRGVRDGTDLDFELRMSFANRRLDPRLETVFFTPSEEHALVSASLVREISRYGGDVSSFVPPAVLRAIGKKGNSR